MFTMLQEHWPEVVALILFIIQGMSFYWLLRERIIKFEGEFVDFKHEAQGHWGTLEKDCELIANKLNGHLDSPSPHMSCPAHSAILHEIRQIVDMIDAKVTANDTKLFTRMNELERRIFQAFSGRDNT